MKEPAPWSFWLVRSSGHCGTQAASCVESCLSESRLSGELRLFSFPHKVCSFPSVGQITPITVDNLAANNHAGVRATATALSTCVHPWKALLSCYSFQVEQPALKTKVTWTKNWIIRLRFSTRLQHVCCSCFRTASRCGSAPPTS